MDLSFLGKLLGVGGGLGSAGMGFMQGMGKGYHDPSKEAQQMIGQIPGQTEKYYSPYMEAGKGAMDDLQNQYKDLLSGSVYDKLGAGYKESPGYQFKLRQALGAGTNAAAAGGMAGSPMHQQQNMQLGNDIASQDFNDYMGNQMGLYGMGLQGEQGLNQMGYNANAAMADTTGNAMNQQAALNYAGKAGKNTYQQGGWNNLFSGLGMAGQALQPNGWEQMLSLFGGHGKGV